MSKASRIQYAERSLRDLWLDQSDEKLLRECEITHFRAGGPGGQKQNKTSSAVKLLHSPSGTAVSSSESRYQSENLRMVLKKLRLTVAMEIRSEPTDSLVAELGLNNRDYPKWVAEICDILYRNDFDMKLSAEKLSMSPSRLIRLLARDASMWQKINFERDSRKMPRLRNPRE